jgi:hypothetical protein
MLLFRRTVLPGIPCYFSILKINIMHHINGIKKKKHMIISVAAEKSLDEIQHSFVI